LIFLHVRVQRYKVILYNEEKNTNAQYLRNKKDSSDTNEEPPIVNLDNYNSELLSSYYLHSVETVVPSICHKWTNTIFIIVNKYGICRWGKKKRTPYDIRFSIYYFQILSQSV
jgi:hypothetical protein